MSSNDNTANADIPDIDIPTWLELHRLPYSDEDIGVALKKSKRGLFGLCRTHHPDKMEDKEKI